MGGADEVGEVGGVFSRTVWVGEARVVGDNEGAEGGMGGAGAWAA